MPKTSDDIQAESSPNASVQRILSILSDVGCVKILDIIYDHRQPKTRDLGTRKWYYEKITKLTKAQLITKEKKNGKQQQQQTDKEATSHNDVFDSFRLSLQYWVSN